MSLLVGSIGFRAASLHIGVDACSAAAIDAHLRTRPLVRASPSTSLESERSISRAELRRLLELASANGAVALSRDAPMMDSLAKSAHMVNAASSDEDPVSPAASRAPASSLSNERFRVSAKSGSVHAIVAVAHGFAVAVADYRHVISANGSDFPRTTILSLPGPTFSSFTIHSNGGLEFRADVPAPACINADRLSNGRASAVSALLHFSVLSNVSVAVSAGDKPLPALARSWNRADSSGCADPIFISHEDVISAKSAACVSLNAALSITVSRQFVWSLVNDGHTLCLAIPLRASAQPATDTSAYVGSVCVEPVSFDAALGDWSSVISPTHALSWSDRDGVINVSAGGAASTVLLFEPSNTVTCWETLRCRARTSDSSMRVPVGLTALLEAANRSPSMASSPPPALPFVEAAYLPRHIAVIMDGNGRWANGQGLSRSMGHAAGVEAINSLIRACRRLRIPFLTLYAFSAQNWSRPEDEVRALMKLLGDFVATDLEELCANGVRLLVNGDLARLPHSARAGLTRMITSSAGNTDINLCLALSYGGREEIAGAAAAAARAACAGLLDPSALSPETFRAFLPHPHVPDPDLLVRTSGELRVSNFLLWQIAYTELYVTSVLWPDFGDRELADALIAFAARERRFGKTSAQLRGGDAASTAATEAMGVAVDHAALVASGEGMSLSASAMSAVLQALELTHCGRGPLGKIILWAVFFAVFAVMLQTLSPSASVRLSLRAAAEWILRNI
jgi:undecaprenyl diphosphate synthase